MEIDKEVLAVANTLNAAAERFFARKKEEAVKLSDPADKALDATADGAFGGKTNRRAGYSKTITLDGVEYSEIDWIKRTAMKDGTLASGEGRKLVEHYEEQLAALADHRDGWRTQADEYHRMWKVEVLEARRLREIINELRAVVDAAIAHCQPPADDPWGYDDDLRYQQLCDAVQALVDARAMRAAAQQEANA